MSLRRAGGLPMTKLLTAIWNGASMLLAVAAFCMFWGFIAFGIYGVVQWLGFMSRNTRTSI
jgi:hypothetical protein